ncbi:MAG: GNAT family N-acetyltransferase [Clostridia bacterium]|nr:GNAT family N-acetyltransferase [Clostridia bacterium]
MLETARLILRSWTEEDAESLFEYATDPAVGPIAGWPPHESVTESLRVIREVLSIPETYAICLRKDLRAIGSITLKMKGHTDMTDREDECEAGYWLGRPFWGQGIMPEALRELLRHAFEDLGMHQVWCGYYEGNTKSKRAQEKAGFRFRHKSEGLEVPLMHEIRNGYVSSITRDEWDWDRMYAAAAAVRNERRISDYVTCGEVSAAILSRSGKIYTGVCIDTCSTLGICAERNAIFNMITNGEQEIDKVLAILPDGSSGAPCGACRELMVQLMPKTYKDIKILMDYAEERVMTLGELTPEWWI